MAGRWTRAGSRRACVGRSRSSPRRAAGSSGSRATRTASSPADDGCAFEVGASPTSFADAPDRHAFVDPVETVPGPPLARFRLTHTPAGSVLGVGLSHAIVDGFSYFYFLSAWSHVFHGREVPPPWLDRGAAPARLRHGGSLGTRPRRSPSEA